MGRKSVLAPFQSVVDGDMSGDLTSAETSAKNLDEILIEVEWAGTAPVGAIVVEVASMLPGNGQKTQWKTLDFGSPISISGNTGSHLINLRQIPFDLFRIRYVFASGVGVLNAWNSGKTVAA